MAGPSEQVRPPAVAGTFYPADVQQCHALAQSYVQLPKTEDSATSDVWMGGVVPHAGWICSGAIAGLTLATIAKSQPQVDLVVVFGAIHTPIPTSAAALDSFSRWNLPGDACDVEHELRRKMSEAVDLFRVDDRFHQREHAVEVELPLIRELWPKAAILPVEVPANQFATAVGRSAAQTIGRTNLKTVYLASSDLTHYGPAYGFVPSGVGLAALGWAKNNDRRLIDRIVQMQDEAVVPEVRSRSSACGGGAIAAMMSACRELGANRAKLLQHANSYETLAAVSPQRPDNAVGYASIVLGRG